MNEWRDTYDEWKTDSGREGEEEPMDFDAEIEAATKTLLDVAGLQAQAAAEMTLLRAALKQAITTLECAVAEIERLSAEIAQLREDLDDAGEMLQGEDR